VFPHPEQNFAPTGFVLPHLPHATSVPDCVIALELDVGGPSAGGTFTVTLMGCP
jgi:hypothetical protein